MPNDCKSANAKRVPQTKQPQAYIAGSFEALMNELIAREGGLEQVAVLLGRSYNCIRNWRNNSPPLAKTAADLARRARLPVGRVRDAIEVSRAAARARK